MIDICRFWFIIRYGDTMNNDIEFKSDERYSLIVKANELIQKSRFNLSTQQQKIVLYLISQIKQNDDDFKLYKFRVKDFCDMCGIVSDSGTLYQQLKEQIKTISDKSLWIRLENGKETLLRWIEKPYIDEKSGTIEIKLDRDMKPYLLQLQENFTQYELAYTLRFKSKYSIRLYEYIQSIHYDKLKEYQKTISVEELKKVLGADTYKLFKDFNTRVLKTAIKEINETSEKQIKVEHIKENKKVVALKLIIKNKEIIETFLLNRQYER